MLFRILGRPHILGSRIKDQGSSKPCEERSWWTRHPCDAGVAGAAAGGWLSEEDPLVEEDAGDEDEEAAQPVEDDEDVVLDGVGGQEAEEEGEAEEAGKDQGVPQGGEVSFLDTNASEKVFKGLL
jgi:hypothetical protein